MRYRTLTKIRIFPHLCPRQSYVHPNLVLYVAKNRLGYTRIGLTATKKVAMPCSATVRGALCAQHFRNTSRKISADMI